VSPIIQFYRVTRLLTPTMQGIDSVNGWFTACDGFYGASAYWLSHMKQ